MTIEAKLMANDPLLYSGSEYERLNLQVARVIGAKAAVDQALDHARAMKRFPKWMLRYLESAAERLPGLSKDLASFRDQFADFSIRALAQQEHINDDT